jgi:hypothetical protein
LDSAWLVACHNNSVTGEIITVDDEQLAKMRKASDGVRRASAEELVDGDCLPTAWDVPADRPPQVRISVNVQALKFEYKPGWFNFFRSEPELRCLEHDRFSVKIAAETHRTDVLSLMEKISSLFVPARHFGGEASEAGASVPRTPSNDATVCDSHLSSEPRRSGAPSLDVWV